ncbi:MAG TPA: GtrA family protein [bacterium]|nr:GtrA family protein [bacterium]HPP86557.1 GtrA family protein [bacterium]
MLTYSIRYINRNKRKLAKFVIVGGLSFIVNFISYYLYFVFLYIIHFGFNNIGNFQEFKDFVNSQYIHKDISNILSIEISVLVNFILSRNWTWRHIEKHYGRLLWWQCLKFHLAIVPGMIVRAILFSILNHIYRIHDVLNIIIGVLIAMVLNYILYDKLVFNHKLKE